MKAIILEIINLPFKIVFVLVYGLIALIRPGKQKEFRDQVEKVEQNPEPFHLNLRNDGQEDTE